MARFSYSAYDSSGTKRKGEFEADSIEQARLGLERDGFLVTKINPIGTQSLPINLSSKPKLADIEYFTSELSLLLQSGLRIDKGIEILVRNSANPRLIPVLRRISQGLKNGKQLSDALADERQAFDELYISLVRVGEESGDLVGVFDRLASDLKDRKELQNIIQQALVYPTVILAVCIVSVLFIFNYVVPNLTGLFSDSVGLPWYTEALLAVSTWVQQYQLYGGGLVLLVLLIFTRYREHPWVHKLSQRIKDSVIGIKKLSLLAERARFTGGLSVMLNSGLALDRAVKLAINTVQQDSIKQQLKLAHEQLKRGSSFSQAFGNTSLVTDYYRSLIVVGEESGEMARVFSEISQRSRSDLNAWVKRLTTLLEPLMILTMGAIVGTVVVVMMLSINAITDVQL